MTGNDPGTAGIPGSPGGLGIRPNAASRRITVAPTTASNAASRPIDEPIAGTEEPRIRVRASAIFATSPPRAGTNELSAIPAA